ncbi:hypothetical protein OEA41_000709 [Lepraria neglecta]|uniref:Uncharacterized protein n=1 Tax=Lepraria neglecta TaxID=209136 RepID=A0AAE0DQ27_9LECA|nr:hypothetical protein OEA41_000709 [Lepraria neglecta]
MIDTKNQFDATTSDAIATLKNFIENENNSADAIEIHFTSEIERYYERAITELERVLTDSPDDKKDNDECSNTQNADDQGDEVMGSD